MHISIIRKDAFLERIFLLPGFGCPLCPNFSTSSDDVIQRHLRNHTENGVHSQENIICRCNLECRAQGHFHCPFCERTVIRKGNIASHLRECSKTSSVVQPTSGTPSSPETLPLEDCMISSVSLDHSYFLAPPASSQPTDHSYTQTSQASPETPPVATDVDQTTATTSDQPTVKEDEVPVIIPLTHVEKVPVVMPLTHIKCPHCPVTLYQKNLLVHIRRKHRQLEDVTASSHLKSVCIDQSNGIYAVRKTSHDFSVPVHVQRKTCGQEPHATCEMEDCRKYHTLVERSGLSYSMCHHIRSVDYCSTTAPEEPLRHQVLEEMVEKQFLSSFKVEVCKRRQRAAEEACVPLSVFLDLSESKNHFCFSVYEPEFYHHSPLNRVIVTHNIKKNTWHCPCAKPGRPCTHKCIAKWHLFQKHKHLFGTAQVTKAQCGRHPPTTDLDRSVKNVSKSKKSPSTPPEEAAAQRALIEYGKRSFPDETVCQLCPDNPKLEEATQVTKKARIVGLQGVIQHISSYNRQCSKCKLVYRYQEWRDTPFGFSA